MALIRCPECGNSISDRAEKCPHCGLPASYFSSLSKNTPHMKEAGLDYKNLQNVLISFERDHAQLFSAEHYISHRDAQRLRDTYGKYNESLTNKLIFQYVCNNAAAIRVDIDLLRRFCARCNLWMEILRRIIPHMWTARWSGIKTILTIS